MKRILFPDCNTILDMTYGNGSFYNADKASKIYNQVMGLDIIPSRAKSVCGDYTQLPFKSNSFDLVIFDPPYLTDTGKDSVMAERYSSFKTIEDMLKSVHRGLLEASRVSRTGIIVKVQDYIHASQVVWMQQVVIECFGWPYDWVIQARDNKILGSNWNTQLSVYRNHAFYMAYRKGSQKHIRRG